MDTFKIKIWHFGDTHGKHFFLNPPSADVAIFSGDAGLSRDPTQNLEEVMDFLNWYRDVDIPIKIFVAGNHDSSIEKRLITKEEMLSKNIIYLEHEDLIIEVKNKRFSIFGSPYVPTFGNWSFMKNRSKLNRFWEQIPEDTDILVTHGPPMNILDSTEGWDPYNSRRVLENAGCSALQKQIFNRIKPRAHMFGHIHSKGSGFINSGVYIHPSGIIFSNGSCVEDRTMDVESNGNIIEL